MTQTTIFDFLEEAVADGKRTDSGGFLLAADDFDITKRNPRFVHFLRSEGRKVGGEWKVWEFIVWVNKRVCEFKKLRGFADNAPNSYIADFHYGLTDYMREFAEGMEEGK